MSNREDKPNPIEQARRLMAASQFDAAAEIYRAILDSDPAHFEATQAYSECMEKLGRWSHAIDSWTAALELKPSNRKAALGLAEAYRQAQCHHSALKAYQNVLADQPDQIFALAGKGETLRMMGFNDEAIRWFDAALQVKPEHLFALRGKASALNNLHRYNAAIPYWEDALKADPESEFTIKGHQQALSNLSELQARNERGEVELGPPPAPKMDPERQQGEVHFEQGMAYAKDGRLAPAIDSLRQAAKALPQWVVCLQELAILLNDNLQHDASIEIYKQILEISPDRVNAASNVGEILRKTQRFEESITAYQAALEIDSGYIYSLSGMGDALRMLERHVEALEWFDKALQRNPTHAFAMRGKAAALNALGRHEEANKFWRKSLDVEPDAEFALNGLENSLQELEAQNRKPVADHSGAVPNRNSIPDGDARQTFDEGRTLLQQGRYLDAIHSFRLTTELEPSWDEPWYFVGVAWEEDQQHQKAIQAYNGALTRNPKNVPSAIRKADCLRKSNELRAAIAAYDHAISLEPGNVGSVAGRAETLRMLGRFDDALIWFDKALLIKSNHYFATCGKAAALNALHRYDDARPLWILATEKNPESTFVQRGLAHCNAHSVDQASAKQLRALSPYRVRAGVPALTGDRQAAREWLEKGRAFHRDRQYDAAVEALEKALTMDKGFAEAALRLGMVHEDNRKFQQAILAYEKALSLDPDNFQAASNIGEAYRKNEQYHDAITAYDKALDVRSDYLYALAGRAECMRMIGEHVESLAWFERALAQDPRHTFAIQGKAASLNALQRYDEAITFWERALEVDPHSQFAKDGRDFCIAQRGNPAEKESKKELVETTAPEDAEESSTPTLDEQGRDLTALAKAGKLGDVIGRHQEIRSVMKTLVRRQKANPLLLGDPGVGKTAVVEGVAQLLASPASPPRLTNIRIVELSMGSLVAGTKYRGTFEDRIKAIIKEAVENPGIVLFIDEIHTLVGAGRTEGGSLDAANILKPSLARGEINVIGATTLSEYRKHFEADSALERRFQPINIEEPSVEATIELLHKVAPRYAKHHEIEIDSDSLAACVHQAVRFIPDRRLPDKALDLLDEACAEASLSGRKVVTAAIVAEALSERTGIPVGKLTEAERARMANIEQALWKSVVGQKEAVQHVCNTVKLSRAGLRDPKRPRGVFLFVGPSGVGKTALARSLADFLFPEGSAFIKLDMSEYSDKFTSSRLIGAPPGYSGHGEEGLLTGPLRRRPYSVVLLDEFEKAHADVQAMFLSLFEEGTITDSEGRRVEAQEAFFIMTSNIGSAAALKGRVGFGGTSEEMNQSILLEQTRGHFRPELLNRVDEIIPFKLLDDEALGEIVELHLTELQKRSQAEGVDLTWTPEVVQLCLSARKDAVYGARPALRAIDDLVAEPLGHTLLEIGSSTPRAYRAEVEDGKVVFRPRNLAQSDTNSMEEEPV